MSFNIMPGPGPAPAQTSPLDLSELSVRNVVANAILELSANPYGRGHGTQIEPGLQQRQQYSPHPHPQQLISNPNGRMDSHSAYDCASLISAINEETPETPEEDLVNPEDAIELDRAELSRDRDRPNLCIDTIDLSQVKPPEPVSSEPDDGYEADESEAMVTDPPAPEQSESTAETAPELPTSTYSPLPQYFRESVQRVQQANAADNSKIPESRRAQTCQICGKVLAHVSSLYRHHRLTHNKNLQQQLKGKKTETDAGAGYLKKGIAMMTVDKDGKPMARCNLCGKCMPSLVGLRHHKLTVHKLETPAHLYAAEARSLVEH